MVVWPSLTQTRGLPSKLTELPSSMSDVSEQLSDTTGRGRSTRVPSSAVDTVQFPWLKTEKSEPALTVGGTWSTTVTLTVLVVRLPIGSAARTWTQVVPRA